MPNVVGHRPLAFVMRSWWPTSSPDPVPMCMVAARCEVHDSIPAAGWFAVDRRSSVDIAVLFRCQPHSAARFAFDMSYFADRDVTAACLFVDRGPADLVASLWGDPSPNGARPGRCGRISR